MKTKLFAALLFFTLGARAQDCSQEELALKPGTFKPGTPGSIRNVTPADLARERAVLSGIHKMITSNYQPIGVQVSYSYVLGKHLPAARNWIADPYHLAYYVLPFLCEPVPKPGKSFYVAISTPTTVNISANVIFSLNNLYAADLITDEVRGYLLIDRKPERKNGAWFLGDIYPGRRWTENEVHEYRWLITYGDTLPFTFLSRKEYLLAVKKRIDRTLKQSPGEKDYYATYLQNIDEYLGRSKTELAALAYINYNDEERFTGFLNEEEGRGYYAVVPNLAYYRKNLPPSAPQFFSVVYKVLQGHEVFENNIEKIQNAVDFKQLHRLLGK